MVYVKGHQNNPQTPRILPCLDRAPRFEIPGSATDAVLTCLVWQIARNMAQEIKQLVITLSIIFCKSQNTLL